MASSSSGSEDQGRSAMGMVDPGRETEAIAHYGELLRLNPNDNQGVRSLLLLQLTLSHRDDEAMTLQELV